MRHFDLKCEGWQETDGSWTVAVRISGLSTQEQAQVISDSLHEPVKAVVIDVVTNGGEVAHITRNMMEKPN